MKSDCYVQLKVFARSAFGLRLARGHGGPRPLAHDVIYVRTLLLGEESLESQSFLSGYDNCAWQRKCMLTWWLVCFLLSAFQGLTS
jgi:hypothetical protein